MLARDVQILKVGGIVMFGGLIKRYVIFVDKNLVVFGIFRSC